MYVSKYQRKYSISIHIDEKRESTGNISNQFANIHHIFVQTSAEQYLSIFTIGRAVEIRRESTGEEGDGGGDQKDKGGRLITPEIKMIVIMEIKKMMMMK